MLVQGELWLGEICELMRNHRLMMLRARYEEAGG